MEQNYAWITMSHQPHPVQSSNRELTNHLEIKNQTRRLVIPKKKKILYSMIFLKRTTYSICGKESRNCQLNSHFKLSSQLINDIINIRTIFHSRQEENGRLM